MRIPLGRFVLFVLFGCLVMVAFPAGAQFVPPGSYQKTCKDASVGDNDTLLANCRMSDGEWRVTNLPNAQSCRGDIANVNGRLQCVAGQPPGNTTETGEGMATFGGECDGKIGAEHLMLRMWGRADSLVKMEWDKRYPSKIHVILPKGSTYAITCDAFSDNLIFSYANLD
ncbi:MAG TPA: hypothetical protein VLC46_15125 [Thermoanaerobaculia bacterium]|jgi:hypothetical protein|nr:hypothetical protein [Thermoanaerobaculia bacterium]